MYTFIIICFYPGSSTSTCSGNEFKCNNNKCIDRALICDYEDDCGDGTDEEYGVCIGFKDRCDFERGGTCNWIQGSQDTADWMIGFNVRDTLNNYLNGHNCKQN